MYRVACSESALYWLHCANQGNGLAVGVLLAASEGRPAGVKGPAAPWCEGGGGRHGHQGQLFIFFREFMSLSRRQTFS